MSARVSRLLDDPAPLAPAPVAPPAVVASAGSSTAVAPETAPAPVAPPPAPPPSLAPIAPAAVAVPSTAPPPAPSPAVTAVAGSRSTVIKPGGPAESRKETKVARTKEPKHAKPDPASDPIAAPEPPPPGADATDLLYSGKRKLDGGDLHGAIADLKVSQQLRPSPRTLTLLGRAYFDANELDQAAKVLKAAGSHDEAQLLLGTLHQQMGKTANAKKVFEAFLDKHPDHPKADWVRRLVETL
jgi:hypothetical protein